MNPFTDHPRSQGEGYFEHMRFALQFGITMMAGAAAVIVHALLPFLFTRTGSSMLTHAVTLHDRASRRRMQAMRRPNTLDYTI